MLNAKTNFGKMKDSPCQTCIVKMVCDDHSVECLEFSKYITNKIVSMPIISIKPVKMSRRESWVKLKVRAKSALSE